MRHPATIKLEDKGGARKSSTCTQLITILIEEKYTCWLFSAKNSVPNTLILDEAIEMIDDIGNACWILIVCYMYQLRLNIMHVTLQCFKYREDSIEKRKNTLRLAMRFPCFDIWLKCYKITESCRYVASCVEYMSVACQRLNRIDRIVCHNTNHLIVFKEFSYKM